MDQEAILRQFLKWEREVSYMYLDSTNHVTVGIGHLLRHVEAAQDLAFIYRQDHPQPKDGKGASKQKGQLATREEIAADYNRIMKLASKAGEKQNLTYKAFNKHAELELAEDSILRIFYDDVSTAEDDLAVLFPEIDSYPVQAQMALMDMVYNMGRGKLKRRTALATAIKGRDWAKAATKTSDYCYRDWVGPERNEDTAALFLSAVAVEKQQKGKDPETPKGRPRNISSPLQCTIPDDSLLIRQRSVPPR